MLIEKIGQMAYEIADGIEETSGCLAEIRERWNREEEVRDSLIEVALDNLKQAHHQAVTIEIAMKRLSEDLATVGGMLNENNY